MASTMTNKYYLTYNQALRLSSSLILNIEVHKLCQTSAALISETFNPDYIIAIGGGGFIPARIMRTYLKSSGRPIIPIYAIGLSLYEEVQPSDNTSMSEKIGKEVIRTQWFNKYTSEISILIGKRVLIIDEIDDSRTTLHYALRELQSDVAFECKKLGKSPDSTVFGIFVLHNKLVPKCYSLPTELLNNRYWAAETVGPVWIEYPWEQSDIELADSIASGQPKVC